MQRRSVMVVSVSTAVVLLGAFGVQAISGPRTLNPYGSMVLNRQTLGILSTSVTTSSTAWQAVPHWGFSDGPSIHVKSALTATLSVTVSGGPAAFEVVLELGRRYVQRRMNPPVTFDPSAGTESFSYTFVSGSPTGWDTVNLFWRSPSGAPVTLQRGTVELQYDAAP